MPRLRSWIETVHGFEFGRGSLYTASTYRIILINGSGSLTDASTTTDVLGYELLNANSYARMTFNPATNPSWNITNGRSEFPTGEVSITFTAGGSSLTTDGYAIVANSQTDANKSVASISADTITCTAHGQSNNDKVFFKSTDTYPTGISAGTVYFARNVATNTFQIATTSGGTPISLGTSWSGTLTAYFQKNAAVVGYDSFASTTIPSSGTLTVVANFYMDNA